MYIDTYMCVYLYIFTMNKNKTKTKPTIILQKQSLKYLKFTNREVLLYVYSGS